MSKMDLPHDMTNVFAYIVREVKREFDSAVLPLSSGKINYTITKEDGVYHLKVVAVRRRLPVTPEMFMLKGAEVLLRLGEELNLHDPNLGFATVWEEVIKSSMISFEIAERDPTLSS